MDIQSLPEVGMVLFDRYKLVDILGETEYSITYRARDVATNKQHTLKTPKLLDEQTCKEFEDVSRSSLGLHHVNMVESLDCLVSRAGRPFLVTNHTPAITLEELVDSMGPIKSREDFSTLLLQVCDALDHIHQQGLSHGNLKPSNVMIIEHEGAVLVKLTDRGFNSVWSKAREHAGGEPKLEELACFSPEHCKKAAITVASDIYQLGLLSYYLLTGRFPYQESSTRAMLYAHCNNDVPFTEISAIQPELHRVDLVEELISEMVDSDIDWRVQDIDSVRASIKEWLDAPIKVPGDGSGDKDTLCQEISEETPIKFEQPAPSLLTSTALNLVSLKRKQSEQDETIVGQFVDAVAKKGPRRSPAQSAMLVLASGAFFIIMASTALYVYFNLHHLHTPFVDASRELSIRLGFSRPSQAEEDEDQEENQQQQPQQLPGTTAGRGKKSSVRNLSRRINKRSMASKRRFKYSESPTYKHFRRKSDSFFSQLLR